MSIEQENNDMLRNQIKEVTHHSKEIKGVVTKRTRVEPWVVAKMERAATDLSDVTHYLDGEKYADGGGTGDYSIVVIKPLNTRVGAKILKWLEKNNIKMNFDGKNNWHTKGYGEEIWMEDEENEKNSHFTYIFDLNDFSNRKELEKGLNELENQNEGKIQIFYLDETPDWVYESYENDYAHGGSMYGDGGSTYQIQIENKTEDDNYQIELEKIKLISKKSDFDLVKGFIEEDKFFLSFWKNQNRLFTISGTWYDESGMEATFTKESDGQQVQFDWHPFNSMGGFNKEQFIENLNKALKELNVLNTSNKKSSVSRKKSSVKQITKSEIKEIVDKVGNVQIWSDGKYYVIHKSFTGKKYYLTIDGAMAGRDEYFGSATLKLPDTLNYTEIKFSDLSPVIAAERFNDKSLAKYSDGGSMYADGGGLYDYKIGDYAWIRKADYNEYYGEIIDIRNLEMNLDLGKGVKGTQNEIYATIIDENGKEQSGELLPKNYADGGSTYADGGEIKVGDQFVNTERGEKFYIEKIDTSDKSFPFYVWLMAVQRTQMVVVLRK